MLDEGGVLFEPVLWTCEYAMFWRVLVCECVCSTLSMCMLVPFWWWHARIVFDDKALKNGQSHSSAWLSTVWGLHLAFVHQG